MPLGKKVTALGLAGILVVAAVVAVTVSVKNKNDGTKQGASDINANMKAVNTVCEPTDHKDVCVKTLKSASGNVTDPKELVKIAFDVTVKQLGECQKNFSRVLIDLGNDPRTSKALDQCNELVQLAMRDLSRTKEKLGSLGVSNIDEILANMKIWLSASLTYEETCLDGFENTTGNASQKMKEYLKTAMDLTENTLGMVTEVASALSGKSFSHRRLLSADGSLPAWAGASTRKLLAESPKDIKADVVVAKDGSGKFKTINEALASVPTNRNRSTPYVVQIKEGVYVEKVMITQELVNLVIVGDGPTKTKITGNLNVFDNSTTYTSATFAVMADNFVARDIGFENSAGAEKHQAVAVRVSADYAAFQNCRFDGYQDTLYTHNYRQFYRDCTVTGTIDFIFGDAAVVFQNCKLLVRRCSPNQFNAVTAQGRKNPKMPTGTVIQNCTIAADPDNPPLGPTKSYLGRPWKEYSRTVIMESDIGSVIDPEGFMIWNGDFALQTLFYAEYNNRGPGSGKAKRVRWAGVRDIKGELAEMFTAANFVGGDKWIPAAGVPYTTGLTMPTAGLNMPTPLDAAEAVGVVQSEWRKDLKKEDYKDSAPPAKTA